MRSARPGVAATNTIVSLRSRARLTSLTHSDRRPANDNAGWQAMCECEPRSGPGRVVAGSRAEGDSRVSSTSSSSSVVAPDRPASISDHGVRMDSGAGTDAALSDEGVWPSEAVPGAGAGAGAAGEGLRVALGHLREPCLDAFAHVLRLGDQHDGPAGQGEIGEQAGGWGPGAGGLRPEAGATFTLDELRRAKGHRRRRASVTEPLLLEPVPKRHDAQRVDWRHRSLRRGIEAPDHLDRVADEFQAGGLILSGREDVGHPAANAEGPVIFDRVLA